MGIETCEACMWFKALKKDTACPKCNTKNSLALCSRIETIHCLGCEDFPVSYSSKDQELVSGFGICRYPILICHVSKKSKGTDKLVFIRNLDWIDKLYVHKSFNCMAWEIREDK